MLLKLLSIISLLSLSVYAESSESTLEKIQKSGQFVVCSESGQIPYEMRRNNGDWYGFDIDMMQSFSKSLHVALVMKDTNWDGIIPALISGKCDAIASSMVVTEERKKNGRF